MNDRATSINGPRLTQCEVAQILGMSQQAVQNTERRALKKLRARLGVRLGLVEEVGLVDTVGGLNPNGPTHQTPTHGILSPGGSNPN